MIQENHFVSSRRDKYSGIVGNLETRNLLLHMSMEKAEHSRCVYRQQSENTYVYAEGNTYVCTHRDETEGEEAHVWGDESTQAHMSVRCTRNSQSRRVHLCEQWSKREVMHTISQRRKTRGRARPGANRCRPTECKTGVCKYFHRLKITFSRAISSYMKREGPMYVCVWLSVCLSVRGRIYSSRPIFCETTWVVTV